MLLDIDGQQFHIKGVFEYDPLNPHIYENGDIVYVPGDPKLYIYYNDSNASSDYANHGYLYPLWYKDVVTNLYDYVAAEVVKEWQLSAGNIDSNLLDSISKFLMRPVATELLTSILNAKFGTGILTPDGNNPLDLNKICRNGRYVIVLGNINSVNNLPSVITTNFLNDPPYPNNIIGLDVWVGRNYASPPPNSNGNEVIISGYVIRQTVFVVLDDKMIIATRSGNVILNNQVTLTVGYDSDRNKIILDPPEAVPQFVDICGDRPTTWNDWTVLQQYPVNVLFNYFANRIDTLITSFNHAADRMVLGIRPLNYRLVSMPLSDLGTPPDSDTTVGNLCLQISLADLPLSLHSLSQISAVVINAVVIPGKNAQEIIQQFIIPVPYSKPLATTPYLPNSKIVFSGNTKFYIFYTPWASSTQYGVVLNVLSEIWNSIKGLDTTQKQNNITDIILLT
jgi:hypothetical protein